MTRKVLVSTMKDEGPYLLEWLAYHRSIGFEEFCIFSSDSADGTNLMPNRLDPMGAVRHFDNPLGPRMDASAPPVPAPTGWTGSRGPTGCCSPMPTSS